MNRIFRTFHYVSFLQYLFYGVGLFYAYRPLITGMSNYDKAEIISNYNLVFLLFLINDESLKELSTGIFVIGMGMIGLVRMNLDVIKTNQDEWRKSTNANNI